MTDWLVFAGYLVITVIAMAIDGMGRANAEDARLAAFVAEDCRNAVVEPDAVERLGPLELGWLSTFHPESAKQGAVGRLVADGALHRLPSSGPGPQRWVARGSLPKDADDFERELWTAAVGHSANSVSGRGYYLWALPNAEGLTRSAETRLINDGYARRSGELLPAIDHRHRGRHRGRGSTTAAALALPVIAVLLLDQAWIRAVLALLIGVGTLGAATSSNNLILPRRLPTRTAKGDLALHQDRERFADLNPATRPTSHPYDPHTIRMAVALFGTTVLNRIDNNILTDWENPSTDPDGPGGD